jgi:hypothetical protein
MIYESKTDKFIKNANYIHNNKYNYDLVNYINAHTKINIICNKHGIFQQMPYKHLIGRGCRKCSDELRRLDYDVMLFRFKKIHGNSYLYNKLSYSGTNHNMEIFCNIHKIWFNQQPHSHLKGYGCPICKKSNGELKIKNWLDENNIEYEINKRFVKCHNIKELSFDFYLIKKNILIEYDGEQHLIPKNFGGISIERAKDRFDLQKIRDNIKNNFVINENIKLIRILYYENIVEKLKKELL